MTGDAGDRLDPVLIEVPKRASRRIAGSRRRRAYGHGAGDRPARVTAPEPTRALIVVGITRLAERKAAVAPVGSCVREFAERITRGGVLNGDDASGLTVPGSTLAVAVVRAARVGGRRVAALGARRGAGAAGRGQVRGAWCLPCPIQALAVGRAARDAPHADRRLRTPPAKLAARVQTAERAAELARIASLGGTDDRAVRAGCKAPAPGCGARGGAGGVGCRVGLRFDCQVALSINGRGVRCAGGRASASHTNGGRRQRDGEGAGEHACHLVLPSRLHARRTNPSGRYKRHFGLCHTVPQSDRGVRPFCAPGGRWPSVSVEAASRPRHRGLAVGGTRRRWRRGRGPRLGALVPLRVGSRAAQDDGAMSGEVLLHATMAPSPSPTIPTARINPMFAVVGIVVQPPSAIGPASAPSTSNQIAP